MITKAQGLQCARELGAEYVESSALENTGVDLVFIKAINAYNSSLKPKTNFIRQCFTG